MSGLAYRLSSPSSDRHITSSVEDATIRSASPGGFTSVECQLHKPILDTDVAQFNLLTVYDNATAEIVGQGRLEDPGQSSGDNGEVWSLTAIGMGPAHTADITRAYVALDSSMDTWEPLSRTISLLTAENTNMPDGSEDQGLVFSFPRGAVLVAGDQMSLVYKHLTEAAQLLGGFGYRVRFGGSSADYGARAVATDGTTAVTIATTASTAGTTTVAYYCSTDFVVAKDQPVLRGVYTGAGVTVAGDNRYHILDMVWVAGQRKDKSGNTLTGSGNYGSTILLSQVVEDLLGGGMLPLFDGPNSTIATTGFGIDQASWPDGATAAQVLDDLLQVESGYTWHVWGQDTGGKWPFELVAWPTTVGYETTVDGGWDAPASSADLYDQVQVRGVNSKGKVRHRFRTQSVPVLTAAGIHRQAVIDLGDEVWSTANADRVGDRFLADHAVAANAGTLRISTPVKDLQTGRTLQPHQMTRSPGSLIRVRGVRPSVDSLNATDRDGVTVFRIKACEYRDGEGVATLELDTFSPTEAREIARANRRRRKR